MKKIIAAVCAMVVIGVLGYAYIEKMAPPDALLTTVSVMTTAGAPHTLSQQGKLFTSALILMSVGLLIAAVAQLLNPKPTGEEELLTGFFGGNGDEKMVMKELAVSKASPCANKRKADIIQKHGVVVVGIKRKGGFDIDVPLSAKIPAGSSVLVLGSPATILGVEKKR